jgi:hypothetical protein
MPRRSTEADEADFAHGNGPRGQTGRTRVRSTVPTISSVASRPPVLPESTMITSSSMCHRLSQWAPGTRKSREGSGRLGDGLGVAVLTEREGQAWLGLECGGNRLVVDIEGPPGLRSSGTSTSMTTQPVRTRSAASTVTWMAPSRRLRGPPSWLAAQAQVLGSHRRARSK